MYLWRTKFREKKPVVKEFGNMFAPSIWVPIHMVRKDGNRLLGRYICKECGTEQEDEPMEGETKHE